VLRIRSLADLSDALAASTAQECTIVMAESELLRPLFDRAGIAAACALAAREHGYEVAQSAQHGAAPWHDAGRPGTRRVEILFRRAASTIAGSEPYPQPGGHRMTDDSASPSREIRSDGFYVNRDGEFGDECLRFYAFDSGKTVFHARVSRPWTAGKIAIFLSFDGTASFYDWTGDGAGFSFTETWPGGAVTLQGRAVSPERLVISSLTTTEGRAYADRAFEFVEEPRPGL
jgi:hypothetical protein